MLRSLLWTLTLTAAVVALAGCAAANPWLFVAALSMGLATLTVGCGTSHRSPSDGSVIETDGSVPGDDGGGTWESCCNAGVIDSCYCPPATACNYGWYVTCGDGSCAFTEEECAVAPDAGVDAGGTWEACCVSGRVDTCFCPADLECNYGWYTDCGGGTCIESPGATCPGVDAGTAVDAGASDAGPGTWDPCCVDGLVTTCFCPAGAICNYFYTDCGDGVTCALPGETCAAPPP